MSTTFMSPLYKARRESDLERMRERWTRDPSKARKGKPAKARLTRDARARINARNASGPRPWARSPLTEIIEGLKDGDTVWLETESRAVHDAARTAGRTVATRTAFKNGVKGVRVVATPARKKRKKAANT